MSESGDRSFLDVEDRAGVAQSVEQLPCKQQVAGSSPTASSLQWDVRWLGTKHSEGFPSGQREQTVNLPAYAFGGSNPPPSTMLGIHAVKQPRE